MTGRTCNPAPAVLDISDGRILDTTTCRIYRKCRPVHIKRSHSPCRHFIITVSRGSAYTVVTAMHESMGNGNFGGVRTP